jgi:exodeoxyribonuclease-3
MRILSWNINGLRAAHKRGFRDWLLSESPDILCLQETKASEEQVPEDLRNLTGYNSYFVGAERKGYSGVALWTRKEPKAIETNLRIPRFDIEGRMIRADYRNFTLLNLYFPNGGASHERLEYKLDFYDSFLHYLADLRKRSIIICGDFNTAHKEIDLARPKENRTVSGFLPEERAWIDRLTDRGFIDTFRMYNQEPGHYTWWDYQTRARTRNVGWRIDYFFVSRGLKRRVTSAFIMSEVMGSDHCPIGIEITA